MSVQAETIGLTLEIKEESHRFYDSRSCQMIQCPQGAEQTQDYFSSLLSSHSTNYIENIETEVALLQVDQHLLPVTINYREYENAHPCSQFTKYVTYAKQEFILNSRLMRTVLKLPLNGLGVILKATCINQIVSVNNWLFCTNIYPHLNAHSLESTTQFLVAKFPQHAIMFPSLNTHTNEKLMQELKKQGYLLLPSREVFICDPALKEYASRRINQTDFDLLRKTSYKIVPHNEITEKDYDRIVGLYELLYIEKYSQYNPKFTRLLVQLWHNKKILNFQGLRDADGILVGIIASREENGILVTPLVGYDLSLPSQDRLYRMLNALSMQEALEKKIIFNMGSGAAQFKKWRGGVGFIEYSAVYVEHLPLHMRLGWKFLDFLMNRIGVPLLKKYRL